MSAVLHCFSQGHGSSAWIEGLVDEVAKQIFGIQIRMEKLQGRDTEDSDHEVKSLKQWAPGREGGGALSILCQNPCNS